MTTKAVMGIHADYQAALDALTEAIQLHEAAREPHLAGRVRLYERLDYWYTRMSKESIDGYVLGIGCVDGWTLIEEPQTILPCDIELIKQISIKLCTTVGGYLVQTTGDAYGFIDCRNGHVVRHFLSVNGDVLHDEGTLDDEPPPLVNDAVNGVERAWQRLVPTSEPGEFEVRLFTNQKVGPAPLGAGKSGKPWWKIF